MACLDPKPFGMAAVVLLIKVCHVFKQLNAKYDFDWTKIWSKLNCLDFINFWDKWSILNPYPAQKMSSAKCLVCINFKSASSSFKFCETSVKQRWSGWDAELLGVLAGSKLFACVTMVAIGRIRVKIQQTIFLADENEMYGKSRISEYCLLCTRPAMRSVAENVS